MLDIDTALPCGLILNELVSNALKYTFPEGKSGEVRVSQGVWMGVISCRWRMMGKACRSTLISPDAGTLGMKLVKILADQLRGTSKWATKKEPPSVSASQNPTESIDLSHPESVLLR